MGRPRKEIDPEQVRALAEIGCSYAEIGAVVGCDSSTLTRRFAQVIKDGHEVQKSSLRRMQWKAAEGGNATMLLWLGKQYLGQSDKQELTGKDGEPLAGIAVTFVKSNEG